MFENLGHFFKKIVKEPQKELGSKDAAKERLHLVLMQDRANVSADFLELMKQEIIDVIKKYIVVDEESIDVRLTNQENEDGTNGAPALFANIPIVNIKNDMMAEKIKDFEGVDFNKEMGLTKHNEENEENKENVEKQEIPKVIELPESSNKIDEKNSKQQETKREDSPNGQEEVKEMFEEVDDAEDDDDDVTFDDLLKAAEAADKNAEQKQEHKPVVGNQPNKNQPNYNQQKNKNDLKNSKDKFNKKK